MYSEKMNFHNPANESSDDLNEAGWSEKIWSRFKDKFDEHTNEDSRFAKSVRWAKKKIEDLSTSDRLKFLDGFSKIGHSIDGFKNNTMATVSVGLANSFENKYLKSYFEFNAKHFEEKMVKNYEDAQNPNLNDMSRIRGIGSGLAGNLLRIGRVASDVTQANPFRHIMAGSMLVGHNAEIVKKMRLSSETAMSKVRVGSDERDEDGALIDQAGYDRAWDEAQKIYKMAQGENPSGEVSTEDLREAYLENLPKDVLDRLSRNENFDGSNFLSKGINWHMRHSAGKIEKELAGIETSDLPPQDKEKLRHGLIMRNKKLLEDLDGMVGDQGTIDTISYLARATEKGSKTVATAMTIDSAYRAAKLVGHLGASFADWVSVSRAEASGGTAAFQSPRRVENGVNYYPVNQQYKVPPVVDKLENEAGANQGHIESGRVDDSNLQLDERALDSDNVEAAPGAEAASARIEIKGKVDTVGEAVGKILESDETSEWVKQAFITHWLGEGNSLNAENLNRALRRMTAANISLGGKDVVNLIHEGDRISLDADGGVVVEESSGLKSGIVSESELRSNAAKLHPKIEPMTRAEAGIGVEVPVGTDQLYAGPAMQSDLSESGKFYNALSFQSPGEKGFYDNQLVSTLFDSKNFDDVGGGYQNKEWFIRGEGDGGLDQDTLQYHPNSESVNRPDGAEIMAREGIARFLKQADKDGFKARPGEKLGEYLARYEQSLKGGVSAAFVQPEATVGGEVEPRKEGNGINKVEPTVTNEKITAGQAREIADSVFDKRIDIKDRVKELIEQLKIDDNREEISEKILEKIKSAGGNDTDKKYVDLYLKYLSYPEDSASYKLAKKQITGLLDSIQDDGKFDAEEQKAFHGRPVQ